MYSCEITYQHIQLIYQNVHRSDFKRNVTMTKEVCLHTTYFRSVSAFQLMLPSLGFAHLG